jgi:hypothetical protein
VLLFAQQIGAAIDMASPHLQVNIGARSVAQLPRADKQANFSQATQ